jgi:hypothetical protein
MTESEELVWFEADGTRHVLAEPPVKTPVVAEIESAPPPSAGPDRETPPGRAPAADESAVEDTVQESSADESVGSEPNEETVQEPSALRGMMRALALGAAAAAATGVAVGAISLAATGDRPDTTGGTVPTTATAVEGSGASGAGEVEPVELAPPTTSADQPG